MKNVKNKYTEKTLSNTIKRELLNKLDEIRECIESDAKYTWTNSITEGRLSVLDDIDDLMLNWKEE